MEVANIDFKDPPKALERTLDLIREVVGETQTKRMRGKGYSLPVAHMCARAV